MTPQCIFPVTDSSHIAEARSALGDLMARADFDETRAGRGNLVITEAGTNILKHAGGGTLLIRSIASSGERGVEVLALDKGPGIADWARSSRDGHSTAGTQGTGLGAMQRLSDEFDVYSRSEQGTALRMTLWAERSAGAPRRYEVGAVCVPVNGEQVCGDAWGCVLHDDGVTMMVADGLGHGLLAHEASKAAVAQLEKHPEDAPGRLLESAHAALRATRGAAIAVARCDFRKREIRYAAVGNIVGAIVGAGPTRRMISHAGIVGHKVHSMRELSYEWPAHSIVVMHSDGLESRWDLERYPGLAERHPALIAGVLYRDFARTRDDVTVVVMRPGAGVS